MTRRVISRYGRAVYPRVQTRRRLCAVHAHATFFTAVENRAGSFIVRRSTESNFLIRENGLEMVHDRTHRVSRCCARILATLSLSLSLSLSLFFFSRARDHLDAPSFNFMSNFRPDRPERGFEEHTKPRHAYCSLTTACILFFFFPSFSRCSREISIFLYRRTHVILLFGVD